MRDRWEVRHGDCREVMASLEPASVDAVVSDPPYGLGFMGKGWDHGVPGREFWEAALRVAKPGAHLLAFGGTRTFHRLVCAIEDAGWEVRDTVMWVYGSGFPKSLDVGKAIDKAAGAERETTGIKVRPDGTTRPNKEKWTPGAAIYAQDEWTQREIRRGGNDITAPATDAAKQWDGWGTALKPAWEPICVARKPLEGTVAANVLRYGTGGVNVDGCRVAWAGTEDAAAASRAVGFDDSRARGTARQSQSIGKESRDGTNRYDPDQLTGRWPANLIHDGSPEVVGLFPETESGANPNRRASPVFRNSYGKFDGQEECIAHRGADSGSAARFFYCAKADKRDRDQGLEGAEMRVLARSCQAIAEAARGNVVECEEGAFNKARLVRNHHPTVKPTDLMRWLVRLVTPPGGVVLDPFCGSGSTGKAAVMEGARFIGSDLDPEYVEIARARIAHAARQGLLDLVG